MVSTHIHRLQLNAAIRGAARNAARQGETLHTGNLSSEMLARYPACGMTLREIEDEIIRQVGFARGSAEIEHGTANRRAG